MTKGKKYSEARIRIFLAVFLAVFSMALSQALLASRAYADDNFSASITSSPVEPTIDTTPTFEFTTTYDESAFTFQCFIDNLSMGECVSPVTVSDLDPGEHTFYIGLRDNFGNFSPVTGHAWTINTLEQGDGSPEYPLAIASCQELQDIENNLSAAYKLVNDIDCDGFSFEPIGSDAEPFTGNLNGNGYVISNVTIDINQLLSTGLFANVEGASITALRLKDSVIANTYASGNYSIGGIVGVATDSTFQDITTDNISVSQEDNGSSGYAGGLIGAVQGNSTIIDSYFNGSVYGLNNGTGGITGFLLGSSSVSNSYSEGIISGASYVGGLVGNMSETSEITDSYTAMLFEGQPEYSGGLVGVAQDSATIDGSFSVADMTGIPVGPLTIGGIIGYAVNTTGTVTDVYFDATSAGRSACKGGGTATITCTTTTTDPDYFLGNDTNGPLATWSQGNPWNLHEEGQLPTFAIGASLCDDPETQSESTLLFGCDWGRQTKHHYSGNAVSREIRYRLRNSDDPWVYQNWPLNTLKVLITGLLPATDYEVQFHAYWTVGTSDWTETTALLSTGADVQLDTDGDGIVDSVELNGPNYGDANGDAVGIDYNEGMDSQQANVTSFKNPVTNQYVVLQSDCSSNAGLSISPESSEHKDSAYDFSAGLMNFTATGCGSMATFTQYFYGDYDAAKYIARKYSSATHTYSTIPGAVLSNVTINGQKALKIVYQITDNSAFDDDPATVTIKDPSGPALASLGAPNTGIGH